MPINECFHRGPDKEEGILFTDYFSYEVGSEWIRMLATLYESGLLLFEDGTAFWNVDVAGLLEEHNSPQ